MRITTKLCISILSLQLLNAEVINIPADFSTIQAGLNSAVEGDSVLVAPGTYVENITWPATNGIKLIGSGESDCIIDGNQQASVIRFEEELNGIIDTTTMISGFTITNGSASSGGGISCSSSSPSLENVTITGNSANYGGGIYCRVNSSPSLVDVTISNNSANYGGGGGMYCFYNSSPSFSSENRCNIYSNNTTSRGSGADIYSYECDVINVIVDTFTVMTPTDYHVSPLDNFTFDILNAVNQQQVDADLYVSPDGDNSNDGLTAETPLKTIQYATGIILADSTNPHTIHLANGVYSPSTNGEFFPVEVINYVSLVGESEDNVILDADSVAGVMKCIGVTSSTISHLTLTNGSASYGGGMYCSYNSSPSLVDVTITGNSASYGGGISCWYSSPSLENVTITDNSASFGGGMYCSYNSSPSLENVTISNNSASDNGGGIYCRSSSSPSLVNVSVSNNSAVEGGGMYCSYNSSPSLENVTISNNSASVGGGILCAGSNPSLVDVTITGNSASFGGGILCADYSSPSLVNCILWNDAPQEVYFYGSYSPNSIIVAYSDIQGGEAGIVTNDNGTVYWEDGNIDLDPLFTDTENGDYTLQENSPCIDTGTAFFVWESDTLVNMTEEEYYGTAPDMGAFESQYTVGIDPLSIFPSTFSLNPAYPNPFNPSTTISYSVETNGRLSLQIYDIAGRLVETLVNGITEPGIYTVKWDASGYSSGVYFVQLQTKIFVKTQKLILLK